MHICMGAFCIVSPITKAKFKFWTNDSAQISLHSKCSNCCMINKLVVAFFGILIVATNAGCFGKSSLESRVVYANSIKKHAENPSLTEAPLHTGQEISIYTKEGISVKDTKVYSVNMIVTDFDTEKIIGNLLISSSGTRTKTTNDVVEVSLEDIDFVSVWERKTEEKEISIPALPESANKMQNGSFQKSSETSQFLEDKMAQESTETSMTTKTYEGSLPPPETSPGVFETGAGEKLTSPNDVVDQELVKIGDQIAIYTKDGNFYVMYVSRYDSESFTGYVTKTYEKATNEYESFPESNGITKNLKKIRTAQIDKIDLLERYTPYAASKSSSKSICKSGDGDELIELGTGMAYTVIAAPLGLISTTTGVSTNEACRASYLDDVDGMTLQDLQLYAFIANSGERLAIDIARGEGEHVKVAAHLKGCPVEAHDRFAKLTQENFDQIYSQPEIEASAILANLTKQVSNDPILYEQCNLGS